MIAGFAYITASAIVAITYLILRAASAAIPSGEIALRTQIIRACTLGTGTFRGSSAVRGALSAGGLAGRKAADQAWLQYARADSYTEDRGVLIQRRVGEVR